MAYILHIDTSAQHCHVAVSSSGNLVSEKISVDTNNHATILNHMMEEVLVEAGHLSLQDLDAVDVMAGPGSYTGLRIGLATAKALCYALDKPLLLSNKLTLLAFQDKEYIATANAAYIGAILPARKGEYFVSVYHADQTPVIASGHMDLPVMLDAIDSLQGKVLLSGKIALEDSSSFSQRQHVTIRLQDHILTSFWCCYSYSLFSEKKFTKIFDASPLYLKNVYIHNSSK